MQHCQSITAPSGRKITPATLERDERIAVVLDRQMLVAALRALWDQPVAGLDEDRAYEELADAYEDLTGEEFA